MFMAYLSQLCSQKSTFEVLLRPALGPCWPTSGLKMKHEKGVWGFMVHVLGSCWSCRDHVGPFWAYVGQFGGCSWPILANFVAGKAPLRSCWGRPWGHVGLPQGSKWSMKTGYGVLVCHVGSVWVFVGLCWAVWRMFMAYLSQLCSQKSTFEVLLRPALGPCWATSGLKMKHENGVWGFMVHVLGSCWSCRDHVGPFWAYVGQFGGCSWPILANFVAGKAPLRSCWGRPWGHVGLPQGSKWSMKTGYGVSWFMCWALVGHVGTMLGLSGLMLGNLEDVHGLS